MIRFINDFESHHREFASQSTRELEKVLERETCNIKVANLGKKKSNCNLQVRFKGDKIRQGKSRGRSRYRREGHRVEQWGVCLQLWE